jgi:DNA-binding CsgD family transcriptional regulator
MTNLELASGHFDAATAHLEEGLRVARQLADTAQEAILLVYMAELMMVQCDDAAAEAALNETLPKLREQRATRMVARSLQLLAQVCARRGQHSECRRLLEESLNTWNAVRGHQGAAWVHLDLGQLDVVEGAYDTAGSHFAEALKSCCDLGDRWGIARCLEAFATLAVNTGSPEHAVRLAGAADRLRESAGVAPSSRRPASLPHDLVRARQTLGGARYSTAWEAGGAMSAEQAVRLARQIGRANAPDRLTHREREVVSLVALGLTNRQIADKLVIDLRTAETHVSNMLGKLGLSSRAQLAVWAAGREPKGAG